MTKLKSLEKNQITKKDLELLELNAIRAASKDAHCYKVIVTKFVNDKKYFRKEFVVNENYIVCEYNYKQKIGFVTLNGLAMGK